MVIRNRRAQCHASYIRCAHPPNFTGGAVHFQAFCLLGRSGGGGGGGWASRTQKHSEAGYGRPVDGGVWTAKTVKRPRQQPAHPPIRQLLGAADTQSAHLPHPAQPQHTDHWAPRTRKRHQQEHRPQRPTERSDPTQHAKGRTGDCPGPRKGTTTRRNVTQGDGSCEASMGTGISFCGAQKAFSKPS